MDAEENGERLATVYVKTKTRETKKMIPALLEVLLLCEAVVNTPIKHRVCK